MRCIRCGSRRIIKFIDGLGEKRIFCRNCGGSYLEESVLEFGSQARIKPLFKFIYTNPRALAIR